MKLSSIFKGRLYTIPMPSSLSKSELLLVKKVINSIDPKLVKHRISLLEYGEDYDTFIIDSGDRIYSLKLSLDSFNQLLLNEIENTKNIQSPSICKYINSGTVKIGENLLFLFCEFFRGESIMDIGRSEILNPSTLKSFIDSYKDIHSFDYSPSKEVDIEFNFDDFMGKDQIEAIDNHSDFKKIQSITKNLHSEYNSLLNELSSYKTGLIINNIHASQIFSSIRGIKFNDLRFLRKGHVFSDIANLVFSFNLSKKQEKSVLNMFCLSIGVEYDWSLYKKFYELECRKKALTYIIKYFKEVYLYESQRLHEILSIIDEFSLSYERLCDIPVFNSNKDFIRKNITESILQETLK